MFTVAEGLEKADAYGPIESRVREALKNCGYNLEIKRVPNIRGIVMIKTGEADGGFPRPAVFVRDNPEFILVNYPLIKTTFSAYSYKKEISNISAANLRHSRIGSVRGTLPVDELMKKQPPENYRSVTEYKSLFKMLITGRIDFAIVPTLVADEYLAMSEFSEIKKTEPPVLETEFYVILNKKHAGLKEELEKSLKVVYSK